jgi:hypothetical protein
MPRTKKKRPAPTKQQVKNLKDREDEFFAKWGERLPPSNEWMEKAKHSGAKGKFATSTTGSKASVDAARRMVKHGGRVAKHKKATAKKKARKKTAARSRPRGM